MGVVSNSWFDCVFILNSLYIQALKLTDVQTPFLRTPLVPLKKVVPNAAVALAANPRLQALSPLQATTITITITIIIIIIIITITTIATITAFNIITITTIFITIITIIQVFDETVSALTGAGLSDFSVFSFEKW